MALPDKMGAVLASITQVPPTALLPYDSIHWQNTADMAASVADMPIAWFDLVKPLFAMAHIL